MANDNILCAIMRSHNTCDIMRYYVLLCAIMCYYALLCANYAALCAHYVPYPPPPHPKKVAQKWSKVPKTGRNSILGYKWAYGVVFIDFRGVSLIYYLLHVF